MSMRSSLHGVRSLVQDGRFLLPARGIKRGMLAMLVLR
jgi:hypothetical protein